MDILITEELDSPALRALEKKYAVVREPSLWKDPNRLLASIEQARTVMIRNQTRLTTDILGAAKSLLGIGRVGVGLDNIDVPAATKLGIVVVAPLDANAVSVAELAMGLMLALARKIPGGDASTKGGQWDRRGFTGVELAGRTLAICGFGRIGRLVAVRARAFGMNLVVFDPFVKAGDAALQACDAALCQDLAVALREADFVTSHMPLTPETRRLFNDRLFAAMKQGSYFVNTSRGGVVDESALLSALKAGHLAGAALDVREQEPPLPSELESLNNVILMPHIGAFTAEAQWRTFEAVAGDLDRLLSGEAARNYVNISKPKR